MPEILSCRDCHKECSTKDGMLQTKWIGTPSKERHIFSCKECWELRMAFVSLITLPLKNNEELKLVQRCMDNIFKLRRKEKHDQAKDGPVATEGDDRV